MKTQGSARHPAATRGAAKTSSARRNSVKRPSRTKDPRGGLTAAGRAEFKRKEGANLRPGVTKPKSQMSPDDMRRWGSWAVRFYGRKGKLPPLVDAHGKPTRFALTAAAWGEPVPKTEAAARSIGERGRRMLEKAKRAKAR